MAKIGHSSLDENRKTKGGKAGDQTGREVTTGSWYAKSWSYVLRAKDKNIAERMAKACEDGCANPALGYDQGQRNTLRTQAKLCGMNLALIKTDCECDCSSFMSVCAECAGVPIPYVDGNAPTTSTMKSAFLNTGYFDLLTDKKFLDSDKYLKRGDILVAVGQHTIMCLEDGVMADISKIETSIPTQIKAVDISKYNIITDYKKMSQEMNYVFIRIGYRGGTTGELVEDDLFKKHIKECIANNMNIGLYYYDQSLNEREAIEQADWTVNKLKHYCISQYIKLPIYIDSEATRNHNGRADNISKEQRTKNILAFCNRIQELGFKTGCYASDSWYKTMLNFEQIKHLNNLNIWCARYSTQKPTISKYDIWQYGSEQFIWAQKPIDVNWIYNLPTIIQKPQNEANTSKIKSLEICNKVKVSDYLNVRSQPLTSAPIVDKLYNNNQVQIFGYVHDWYMISTSMDRWVNSKYITTKTGVATTNLNYREGVGTNNKPLGIYEKGLTIKLLNKAQDTNGDIWYLCLDNTDRFGWCKGEYISN